MGVEGMRADNEVGTQSFSQDWPSLCQSDAVPAAPDQADRDRGEKECNYF